jgi:hypothetical protein
MEKPLKPKQHGVVDYVWAGTMIAAPWLFGFHRNKAATINSVATGAAHVGLSLMTKYPLGAAKLVPFPVHGVIETLAGAMTAASPFVFGFASDRAARTVHLAAGLGTFGVVAMTDYSSDRTGYATGDRNESLPESTAELLSDGRRAHLESGAGRR